MKIASVSSDDFDAQLLEMMRLLRNLEIYHCVCAAERSRIGEADGYGYRCGIGAAQRSGWEHGVMTFLNWLLTHADRDDRVGVIWHAITRPIGSDLAPAEVRRRCAHTCASATRVTARLRRWSKLRPSSKDTSHERQTRQPACE